MFLSFQYRTLKKDTPKTVFADWAAGVNATPDRETVERYVDGMVEVCFFYDLTNLFNSTCYKGNAEQANYGGIHY